MNIYVYYSPEHTERLRDWERTVRADGNTPKILTPRSFLGTKLSVKFSGLGLDWLLALHAAGGGYMSTLLGKHSWKYPLKWTKRNIELTLKNAAIRNAANTLRATPR